MRMSLIAASSAGERPGAEPAGPVTDALRLIGLLPTGSPDLDALNRRTQHRSVVRQTERLLERDRGWRMGPATRSGRGLWGSTWASVRWYSSLMFARHRVALAMKNR